MKRNEKIQSLSPDLRLVALTHGLTHCAPDEAVPLAHELVTLAILPTPPIANPTTWWQKIRVLWWLYRRPNLSVANQALVQILRKWDRLPSSSRDQVSIISVGRLGVASAEAIQTELISERIAVALSAQDLVSHELTPILVSLLQDPSSRVITSAERSLVTLANAFAVEFGNESAAQLGPANRTILCNEIARAIEIAPADSKAPFAAAMAILDPSTVRVASRLSAWFLNPDAEHGVLRSSIRNRSNQLSRLRAWQWLHLKHLAKSALDRLVHSTSVSEHVPLVERGHLAIRPGRQVQLQSSSLDAEAILPAPAMFQSLTPGAFAGLVQVAKSLKPSEPYLQHLSLHALNADPLARRRMLSLGSPSHLQDSAFDTQESVARGAMLRWSAVGVGKLHQANLRSAANLARSPHHCVRVLASQELNRLTPGDTNSTQSRMCTWHLLAEDRPTVIAALELKLRSGTSDEQMQSLSLIRRHSLVSDFASVLQCVASESLSGETHSRDPRVIATIISLLGRTLNAIPTLLLASDDSEPRIRANAMESLLRTAPVATAAIANKALERCDDISPRVRANSIRGLLNAHQSILESKPARIYEPHAVSALLAMLQDDRSLHRLSGVWAAERVLCGSGQVHLASSWNSVSEVLISVSKLDSESHVRRRAAAATRRLSAELDSKCAEPTSAGAIA